MITDDVVGRPTELRFFYKEQENDNYVVYFPNFNLTKRDPGMISGVLLLRLKLFAKKLSPLCNFKEVLSITLERKMTDMKGRINCRN